MSPGTPPMAIYGLSGSRETHRLDSDLLNVPHRLVHHICSSDKRHVTINILPDDVLLFIFHFYRLIFLKDHHLLDRSWTWQRLVHVCRRWRSVVFGSPNFLRLRLVCTPGTRIELTDIWPPLPIIITNATDIFLSGDHDFDAVIAYHNRISQIYLANLSSLQVEQLVSAMQVQFPALTDLRLQFEFDDDDELDPLPDGFLSGSVPNLQSLELHSIVFSGLPELLLSTIHLVSLTLSNIPDSEYFSPETMVNSLAVLVNLKSLIIEFGFFSFPIDIEPWLESRHTPPPTRTVLPALTRLDLQGFGNYLDALVARIDVPLLDSISITFFHQLIIDIPRLAQFMGRVTRVQALNQAHVDSYYDLDIDNLIVHVGSLPPTRAFEDKSKLGILYEDTDGLLSSLAHACTSFFPSIYMVEHLYLYRLPREWRNDAEDMQWLEILHPFTAAKSLYLSRIFAPYIAIALQDLVEERVMEVLPALESLFLENLQPSRPVREAIEEFVAARQLLGHPVAVSYWDREV